MRYVQRVFGPVDAVQFWPGEWDRMKELLETHRVAYLYQEMPPLNYFEVVSGGQQVKVHIGWWVCVTEDGFVQVYDPESFALTYRLEQRQLAFDES